VASLPNGLVKKRSKSAHSHLPQATRLHALGYGLPESDRGLLPWSWANQRLNKSRNYWITTVKPVGPPHTMVVWGLWRDGRFLFSTGGKSRKAKNLKEKDIPAMKEPVLAVRH
jgi:hypothetical protein